MALTESTGSNGSWGTEYFLLSGATSMTPVTIDRKVDVVIDFSNLVAGDQYQVIVYERVNGGTARPVMIPVYPTGVQSELFVICGLTLIDGWDIGIKRITGSDRTITWSVRKDDTLGAGGDATAASQASIAATLATIASYIDTEVASIKTTVEALPSADGIIDNECDSTAPVGARTVRQILNIIVSALAGPGADLESDGAVSIQNTGNTKPRIVGTISAGTRTLTSLDGTE